MFIAPGPSEPGGVPAPEDIVRWKQAYLNLPAFGVSNAVIELHAELDDDATGCSTNTNWLAIDDIEDCAE